MGNQRAGRGGQGAGRGHVEAPRREEELVGPGDLRIQLQDDDMTIAHSSPTLLHVRRRRVGGGGTRFELHRREEEEMTDILWLIAAVLLVAWLLGIGGVYSIGGLVHVLLVLAIVAIVVNLFTGRRTVV